MLIASLVSVVMFLEPVGVASAGNRSSTGYSVYVGYADDLRANPKNFPTPWSNSPNVVFEGCQSNCGGWDGGAVMLVNTSSSAETVDGFTISYSSCVFNIWPFDGTNTAYPVTLPKGDEMIFTETATGGGGGCTNGANTQANYMDSSDIGPQGQNWAGNCTESNVIPVVSVDINGTTTNYNDSTQILNTGGVDQASCKNPNTGQGPGNESAQWTAIGQPQSNGLTITDSPATQSLAPNGTATIKATVTNGSGTPLSGVTVDFVVTQGPNAGLSTPETTNSSGKVTFSYSSTQFGIDYVVPEINNPGGTIDGATSYVYWQTATLKLSTSSALPGSTVTFTGTGYNPGENVTLYGNSPSGTSLVTVQANTSGDISGSFMVPVPTTSTPVTSVVAVGAASGKEGWAIFSTGCTDDWVSATSGNFFTASNWSTGSVPGSNDAACIILPGNYTVTMNNNDTVNSMLVGTGKTGTQTLDIQAAGAGTVDLATNAGMTIKKGGVVALDSIDSDSWSMLSGAPVKNSGTLSTIQNAGGTRFLRADINNTGTVSIGASDTRIDSGNALTNSGTLSVASTGQLNISCNGSDVVNQSGGTVTNSGQLYLNCGTWNQTGGALTGNPVIVQSTTFNDSAGTGAFIFQCGNTLAGTVPTGQTVTVQGNGCGNSQTNLSGTVENQGSLVLDSIDPQQWAMINGGTLVNDGSFSTLQDQGATRYLRSNITNNADGTISIGSGDTRIDYGNTLTNAGALTVSAGAALNISCNGSDVVNQSGGTVTNSGQLYLNCGTWNQTGGALTGNPVIVQSTTFNDTAGTGAFIFQCGNTLVGTIPAGQTVTVQANGCGTATTYLSGTVTDSGTLNLDSTSADSWSQLAQASGGGSLDNTGTFATLAGNGGTRYIRVNITNEPGAKSNIAAGDSRMDSNNSLTNNGTVSVAQGGGLSFSSGSTYTMGSAATLGVTVVAGGGAYGLSGSGISVGGKLNVKAVGTPTSGSVFQVINGSPVSGTFASVTSGWTAQYPSNGVTVLKS